MTVEINHEGHEEHEEFATQHRRSGKIQTTDIGLLSPGGFMLIVVCLLKWFRSSDSNLKSLLQLDVPEPAFDRGQRFVVAVLEGCRSEGWIYVEHILHPECNRHVI